MTDSLPESTESLIYKEFHSRVQGTMSVGTHFPESRTRRLDYQCGGHASRTSFAGSFPLRSLPPHGYRPEAQTPAVVVMARCFPGGPTNSAGWAVRDEAGTLRVERVPQSLHLPVSPDRLGSWHRSSGTPLCPGILTHLPAVGTGHSGVTRVRRDVGRREAREAEERRQEEEAIDEMFTICDITMAGCEGLDGLDAVRPEFSSRPGARPRRRGGKARTRLAGPLSEHVAAAA